MRLFMVETASPREPKGYKFLLWDACEVRPDGSTEPGWDDYIADELDMFGDDVVSWADFEVELSDADYEKVKRTDRPTPPALAPVEVGLGVCKSAIRDAERRLRRETIRLVK